MHIAILLPDRFADWEIALLGAIAQSFLDVATHHVTRYGEPVVSMAGLRVNPDSAIADPAVRGADALILCGGEGWDGPDAPDAQDVQSLLHSARDAGAMIGGICAGVVPLARAGLLNTAWHTANGHADLAVAGYSGSECFLESPAAVKDGQLVTAPGTAPVSFAREVLTGLLPDQHRDIDQFLRLHSQEHLPYV